MKLYYTVLEQEAPLARAREEWVRSFVQGVYTYIYACIRKREWWTGWMQRAQGPLTARSSRPRRRMEIIDESQSACLRATNTYLSEIPCNHNKTAAAAAGRVQERERESSIPNNQFVPV